MRTELDQTRRQEALDNLRQKIMDDFGLVMFEYAADVSGPVPLPLDGMVEQLPIVTELPLDLEDQLTQQRAQLRRNEFSHEPRAGFCLMGACQDCWVLTDSGERLRACSTFITPGVALRTEPVEAKTFANGGLA